jgi:tripartite-type tricarboxylate transporter receptor subunit TctC
MGLARTIVVALLAALTAVAAQAQSYPTKPVRIFVGFAAGSGPDVLARTLAQQLATDLGQNFFVENRLGANGTIANRAFAQSDPDGYTLMFSSSSITPTPYIYKSLPYDIVRDFVPIATAGILDGYLMLVNPSTPVRTVPEFLDYAKKNRVLYGSPGVGNSLHLVTELFKVHTGLEMEHVPYKGASEVVTALLGGSIQFMFVTPPSVIALVKEGKLRALGYTGDKPFPEFPEVPLVKASLPKFSVSGSWGILFALAKTPQPIVDQLNAAIRRALHVPAVANIIQRAGYIPDERNAAQTAEFFRQEVIAAGEAVKAARIQPQ